MTTTVATDADILDDIERFIATHDIPPTSFGRRSIGDANLVENLKAGRELRRATRAKVRAFMSEYRPTTDGEITA